MDRKIIRKVFSFILLLTLLTGCETASEKAEKQHIAKANKAIEEKNYILAAEELSKAIELNSRNPLSHYNLAYVLETELKDPDSAIDHYRLAIEYSPRKYSFAYKNIGKLYYEMGDFDSSIKAYKTAIEKLPKDAFARNDLGVVLTKKGLIREAIEELKAAIKLDPANETVIMNLEKAYILLKESKEKKKEAK